MKKISRIFIRLPNWIGDVCMSLSSLNAVIASADKVVICAKPWAQDLLAGYLQSTQVSFLAMSGKWREDARTIKQFRKAHPVADGEVGLLLPDSLTSALCFKFAGLSSAGYKDDGRSLLLNWPIKKPTPKPHAVESWFYLTRSALTEWGFSCLAEPKETVLLPLTDEQLAEKAMYQSQHGLEKGEFILIAPTAVGLHKGKNKVWQGYEQLTRSLQAQGYQVLMCPPPNEVKQATANAPSATLLPALGLGAFAALLKDAALVICNDSGVSHLAAAVNARQMTLIGVTDMRNTAPWSPRALILGENGRWPEQQEVLDAALQYLKAS
ncbi:glycosyltransferase family 9 protein [Oligella sp. HMSC09E12]|uniref:glycosyltransferase family 9 protein n=1 Tax=Oligella sp. HMSC09E12 TaxID=1581147 RepID=UPI000A7CDCFF|nr:glycosyltransferase family 9 protein [Oligella sp. HMSC09E12]